MLEVVVAITIIIPSLLVLCDLYLLSVGSRENEDVCRNTVRAAAAGAPEEAVRRAGNTLDFANKTKTSAVVQNFRLLQPLTVALDKTGAPETDTSKSGVICATGTVAATTEVSVKPFLLHFLLAKGEPFKFKTRQVCRLNYMKQVPLEDNQPAAPAEEVY